MGSGQNVAITLTIDEANALKAWTSQQNAVETLKKRLATLELKKDPLAPMVAGAKNALGTLSQCIVAITGIGGAISAVTAIANQLKVELANVQKRQGGAAGAHGEFAVEMASLIRAAGSFVPGPEMEQMVLKMSRQTGQSELDAAKAVNAAFTARGPKSKEDVIARAEEAQSVLDQYPEQGGEVKGKVTAVVAQNKAAFDLTTQEAIGFQQKAQNASAVKNVDAFVSNVAGKLSGIALAGDLSGAETGALTGAMSQAGLDQEGATSTMAVATAVKELKERLPNLKDFDARLKFMQSDPANVKKYMEGGTFNGKDFPAAETGRSLYQPHVAALFDPKSKIAKEYESNKQEYGNKVDWAKTAVQMRDAVASVPSFQLAKAKRAGEATQMQIQIDDAAGAAAKEGRDALLKNLEAVGETDIAQKLAAVAFEYNSSLGEKGPFTEAARQLNDKADEYEKANVTEMADDGFGNEFERVTHVKTDEQARTDKTKGKRLRELAASMLTIEKDLRTSVVNRNAEAGLFDAREAVDNFEKDQTPTQEEAAATRAKLRESSIPAKAANRFENSLPGDKERDRTSRDRLKKFETEQQRFEDLVKTSDARTKVNAAGEAVKGLQSDQTPTEQERADVLAKLDSAKATAEAGRSAGGSADLVAMFGKLSESIDGLRKDLDVNRKTLDDNSKATEANTGAQGGASTSSPPRRGANVTDLQNRKS